MPIPAPVPAVSYHEPGAVLRIYRKQVKVSTVAAAQAIRRDISTISRIETGNFRPSPLEIERLCDLYGRPAEVVEVLAEMYKMARKRPWWYAHRSVVDGKFGSYVDRERAARCIQLFDLRVPGLVQTEGYMRGLMTAAAPPLTDEEIEDRVRFRLLRQARLDTDPPRMEVILDEVALLRPVGGKDIMAAQLRHLLELASRPAVSIRVLQLSRGAHAGSDGGFTLMDQQPLPEVLEIDIPRIVAYTENAINAQVLDEPVHVATYQDIWAALEKKALGEEESADLVRRIAEGLTTP